MFIQVKELVAIAILIVLTYQDIRRRRISGGILLISFVMVVCYLLKEKDVVVGNHLLGMGVGLGFCLISFATKERMGYGDSLLLCVIGCYVGLWRFIEILVLSWMIVGIVALCLLIVKKCSKHITLPYVPFLLMGYVAQLILGGS